MKKEENSSHEVSRCLSSGEVGSIPYFLECLNK